mmetsp:Transcript_6669/g.10718  ORF Transcript_6669/g.10718 Transcript_6669/m.10718 type:complete len:265 (+) Transcript_6669:98-892(+)
MLKKNPKLANCEFYNGTTNPVCRATYLGHRNILGLLLKYDADINKRSSDQKTPLMWASFRDNTQMLEFLLENGADPTLTDKDGWNALDIAIIRINFQAAKLLCKHGIQRKTIEEYEGKTWRKYDIQMMFESIDADVEEVPYQRFFDRIRKERAEWLSKDLVVDRRESWRNWTWRQFNFEEAPLVPREELPNHLQPQNSIRGKLINYINGIDPRIPHGKMAKKNQIQTVELEETKQQVVPIQPIDPLEQSQVDIEGMVAEGATQS